MRTFALASTLLLLGPPALHAAPQELGRATLGDQGELVPLALGYERVPAPAAGAATSRATIHQMPGWPKTIAGDVTFAPARGLVFADLDRDGPREVLVSSTDGKLYAWDVAGNTMPGFPKQLIGKPQYAPSVADLDGDGWCEIVQFTRGLTNGGRVYVLDHQANVLPGFPKSLGNNNVEGSPLLYDLDDDGALEILAPERAYPIGYLHVLEADGSEWGGNWPVALDHVPTGTPAVGDLDRDGLPEIVYLSYDSIWVLAADGTSEPGWPKSIAGSHFSYQSPALADLDGDGDLELAVGAHQGNSGVYVFHHDGTAYPGWPKLVGTWTYCAPTIVDLEGDGSLDVLAGREGFGPGVTSSCFWAWESNGTVKPGFPYVQTHGGGTAGPITTADVDGDGVLEMFADHNIAESNQGFLFGVDVHGQDLPGFPLRTDGFTYFNGAMIEDVDGDGDPELGVLSGINPTVVVNLFDLGGSYDPAKTPWPTYHQRDARGGREGGGPDLRGYGSAALGGELTLYLSGDPGDLGSLWLATALQPTNTPYGWRYIRFPPRRTLASGVTIPSSGRLRRKLQVPNQAAFAGLTLYFQGRRLWGGGGRMSNMQAWTIR